MVGTSTDVNSATYIGWAPQIAISDSDPVGSWLQKVQTNYGVTLPVSASDFDTKSSKGQLKSPVVVTYAGNNHNWFFYYNNKYIAVFNDLGALMGLTHKTYGMEFINPYLRDPQYIYPFFINGTLGSSTGFVPSIDGSGKLILNWPQLWSTGLNITVAWNLKSNSDSISSSGLNGNIAFVSNGTTTLKNVQFPYSYGFSYGAGKKLYAPSENSGKIYDPQDFPVGEFANGKYPATNWSAQYFAISDGVYSLYIAAEDPMQQPKDFSSYSLIQSDVPRAGPTDFNLYPMNGSPNISPNYNIVISPIVGTWEKASKKYQNWALRQPWGDNSTNLVSVAGRPISSQLKDGVFWWTSNFNESPRPLPSKHKWYVDNYMLNAIGPNVGVNTGIHLYGWYVDTFDTNNPIFTPYVDSSAPTDTWNNAIAGLLGEGALVLPYINSSSLDITNSPANVGRTYGDNINYEIYDKGSCVYQAEAGYWNTPLNGDNAPQSYAIMIPSGLPITGCPDSNHLLASMDPSTTYWQNIVNNNVNTVFNLGATGVYLDTFATADGYRANYNPNPLARAGAPVGYGDWLRNGVRAIGKNTVTSATSSIAGADRKIIAAEHFSEATMAYVDIVMNYENALPTNAPLLQSIYNNYQLMAGQRTQDFHSAKTKSAILGRSFVWGDQLGLVAVFQLCAKFNGQYVCAPDDSTKQYAITLATARQAIQNQSSGFKWHRATFVGLADDANSANLADYSGVDDWCSPSDSSKACHASLPVVRGSLWSSVGTNAADYLVLTNTSSNAVTSTIPVPKAWVSASLVYGSTSGPDNFATLFNNAISVYMPANSVAIYKATSASTAAQHGLTGVYYNTNNFTGASVFTRVDPVINFSWGNGSPGSGVNSDNFSVRWTGKVVPPVSGSYTFCATADDNAKVWVNGVKIIDKSWGEQCSSVTLTQNQPVTLQMDYVEFYLTATAILQWSYPGQAKQVVPASQLYAQ